MDAKSTTKSGVAAAQQFYDEITKGYKAEEVISADKGQFHRSMPDGTIITFRPTSSSDGAPAVTINAKDRVKNAEAAYKSQKIHFVD